VFAPVYYLFGDGLAWYADSRVALAMAIMSGLLIWRHYENINRLLKGTESRLGQKKAEPTKTHQSKAHPSKPH
jgi:glycerol-3-phosphate acyltransferase PlsY